MCFARFDFQLCHLFPDAMNCLGKFWFLSADCREELNSSAADVSVAAPTLAKATCIITGELAEAAACGDGDRI